MHNMLRLTADRKKYFALQHIVWRGPGAVKTALRLWWQTSLMRHLQTLFFCAFLSLGIDISMARGDFPPVGGIAARANFGVTGVSAKQPAGSALSLTSPTPPQSDPGLLCRHAVADAARRESIPDHLMAAIARVESGRRGADGRINPWPWTINAEGVDYRFDTREQAIATVRRLQSQGMRSIDIGCMQVNLLYHPTAFSSLEQGFDPVGNAHYAARLLTKLFQQTGDWTKAVAAYHSFTPERGEAYQRKVAAVLAEESVQDVALLGPSPPAFPRLPGLSSLGAGGLGTNGVGGGGALMLSNRSETARVIPMSGGGSVRNLDAYRSAPIRVATRTP
jgi:hypothetical protein